MRRVRLATAVWDHRCKRGRDQDRGRRGLDRSQQGKFLSLLFNYARGASPLRELAVEPSSARPAFSMAGFTAEAGKVYYFRARLFPGHGDYSVDLDLINSDEGKFLVASSAFCVSHAKN